MTDAATGGAPRTSLWRGRIGLLALIAATSGVTLYVDRWVQHLRNGGAAEDAHDDHGHGSRNEEHGGHGDEHADHAEGRIELTDEARKNAGIELAVAGPGRVDVTLPLPGEVKLDADRVAHVSPRVGGTVREVKKNLGDVVKRGEVLATLDSRELAEISREARASGERLKLAEANFKRVEKLYEDKIVAEKEYLTAKQELAEAKIERDSASQMLQAAGSAGGGSGYPLLSPLDGTIIEKHAAVGEVLKDDTRVFVVADLSKLWVEVTVYAKDLARVAEGQPVRVRAQGIPLPASGTISLLGATAQGGSRATQARVVIDNPGVPWRPGLFVTADVAVEEADAPVVVPDEAIQTVDGKPVVFVEDGGAFEARRVELGRVGLDKEGKTEVVEIAGGLRAREKFVTKGSFILKSELGKGSAGHEH